MKIDIKELQDTIVVLLSKIKERHGNTISINNDYFWEVSEEEIYNPYKKPINLDLGQLSHDFEMLNMSSKTDSFIPYDLQRIANILKAISIENPIIF